MFAPQRLETGSKLRLRLDLRVQGMPASPPGTWPIELSVTVARSTTSGLTALTFDEVSDADATVLRAAVFKKSLQLMQRISEFPAFRDLAELDQMTLTTVCHEVHLAAGEQLARLGDEATSLFLVNAGQVQLLSPGNQAKPGPLETAHAGQIFGEVAALLDLPHNLDIVAETETSLLAIPRESLVYLREHNPNLALTLYEIFAAFMGRRLRRMTARMSAPLNC